MKTKKNIVYVGNFDFTKPSAATNRAVSNIEIFTRNGYDCIICGFGTLNEIKEKKGYIIDSIKKPTKVNEWLKYLTDYKRYKSYLEVDKDTVFILYNLPSLLMFTILFSYRNKAKIISDVTEWYSPSGANILAKFIKTIDISIRMKLLNKKLDGLIVISDYLKDYYSKVPVAIIPPLVKVKENNLEDTLTTNFEKRINYIYSGFPGLDKDRLDLILQAFEKLILEDPSIKDSIKLRVLGVNKNNFDRIFSPNHINFEILDDVVEFHGIVPHQKSLLYLSQSDYSIIIRNSTRKNNAGFPTKFSEASVVGTPIIYSEFSDLSKYVSNNDLKVDKLSVESLTTCIRESIKIGKTIRTYNLKLTTSNKQFDKDFLDLMLKINGNKYEEE